MEISGIIKKIGEAQQITDSFRKRELVVTTEEQYPQHILVEFVQDRTSLLDSFNEGEKVTIGINLRGREWTSPQNEVKYFNSIHGWRIEKAGNAPAGGGYEPTAAQSSSPSAPAMAPMDEEEDDLPF